VCLVTVLCLMLVSSMANAQLKERAEKFNSHSQRKNSTNKAALVVPQLPAVDPSAVMDSTLYQQWDGTDWAHTQSSLFSYSQDLKEQISILRQFQNGNWVVISRTSNKYDEDKHLIWQAVELPSGNDWELSSQKFITYTNGVITEEISQVYTNGTWVNEQRHTAKYDDNMNETELLFENWNGTDWVNKSRFTSEYNSSGIITLELSESWNGTSWDNVYKNDYTYDEANKTSEVIYSQWSGEWIPINKYGDKYGDHNEQIGSIYQEWDGTQWINVDKEIYTYNDDITHMTQVVTMTWNDGTSVWDNSDKSLYTYENDEMVEMIYQEWDGAKYVNSLRNSIEETDLEFITLYQVWDGSDWVNYMRMIYHYRTTTGVEDSERPVSFNLEQNFPNPFNPSTTISYSVSETQHVNLKIFNVLGQVVATLVNEEIPTGTYKVQFNAAGLSSGIYYYRIETAGISETKSMLLLK
jgi:predicted lipoprotein with Yx(FWY)xxD motif